MEKISEEEEVRAMAAARVRGSSAENIGVEELRKSSSPPPTGENDGGDGDDGGGLKMVIEKTEEEEEEEGSDGVQQAPKVSSKITYLYHK